VDKRDDEGIAISNRMKLKSLADLKSPTPNGVGFSPEDLADKTRSELLYAKWNREDEYRSRMSKADRLEKEREYLAERHFGPVMPEAKRKEREFINDGPKEYLSGFMFGWME
jgi:hypothetical protein